MSTKSAAPLPTPSRAATKPIVPKSTPASVPQKAAPPTGAVSGKNIANFVPRDVSNAAKLAPVTATPNKSTKAAAVVPAAVVPDPTPKKTSAAPASATSVVKPATATVSAMSTQMKPPPKVLSAAAINSANVSRMSLAELRKHVESMQAEQDKLAKEKEALERRVTDLEAQLAQKTNAASLMEEKAMSAEQHAEVTAATLRETQTRLSRAQDKLEQLGVDPIALEKIVPTSAEVEQQKAEVNRFGSELSQLHARLHVSHDALQSNIGRMTGILAALNGHASDFADALSNDPAMNNRHLDGDDDEDVFGSVAGESVSRTLREERADGQEEDEGEESFDAEKYALNLDDA